MPCYNGAPSRPYPREEALRAAGATGFPMVELWGEKFDRFFQTHTGADPIDWAFRRQAEHFIACVRNETEPISSRRNTLHNLRLMEEIFLGMRLI